MKPVSLEDAFQMSQAQPASHGKLVTNEYFLAVRTDFEGCTCCATLPNTRIPLIIVPVVNPHAYGFQAPPDFRPHQHDMYNVKLSYHH